MSEQPRETAGVTMRLVLAYVRRTCGPQAVPRLLELAGETRRPAVLEDERVWSSYAARVALFEAAATVTGQPDVGRRIGASVLEFQVGTSMRVVLALLGSPAQLFRGIARTSGKFTAVGDMEALSCGPTSAVLRYRLHDGYPPSVHDCGYTVGLLSQATVLFGLPPATVAHDECQVRGAKACLYRVSWPARPSRLRLGGRRRRRAEVSVDAVHRRLHDLQETVAELVAGRDVDQVLTTVMHRAQSTVGAQRFLLVARLDPDRPPVVRADGLPGEVAESAARRLLADEDLGLGGHTLVAPLRSAAHDHGRLAAVGREGFLDHEAEMLRSYASLAATALDAIIALDQARDRRHVAEVLLGFARALLDAQDRGEVTRLTAAAACSIAGSDAASVLLYDEAEGVLRAAGRAGWPEDLEPLVDAFVLRPEDTGELASLLADPSRPRTYDRASEDPFVRQALATFGTARLVVLPMCSATRLHGVVLAAWLAGTARPEPVPERLFARLAGLADQAAAALERDELVEQVRRQATVDPLTGLANRLTFTDRLGRCLDDRAPADEPSAVLFVDLDGFKAVNDTLGHAAGDELLRVVAARLRALMRTDDTVARLGGDEFTVLLPRVSGGEAVTGLANRVVAALDEPVVLDGRQVRVRPSIGAVLVTSVQADLAGVLRDADVAMYAAKKAGGNRCVLLDPDRAVSAGTTSRTGLPDAAPAVGAGVPPQPSVPASAGAGVSTGSPAADHSG